ncbi:hypothetical protein [Alteromonas flava]|uniref:hypothetical protein n=1 Tax=Alteromonas flava TaxID=2048003 RepID=UPI000C284819|nr:hypothetical protein [Alteromonas flava]
MDVVSAIFATYIDAVSNKFHDRLTDQFGTEVQAKVVQYNGHSISYSHQLWRIQDKSVCGTIDNDLNQKSRCTQAAKAMFNEMCMYLQSNPQSGWRYTKTKNMYCNAATNYKPVIATVSFDEQSDSKKKQEACSVATLRVMESATAENIKARDIACK